MLNTKIASRTGPPVWLLKIENPGKEGRKRQLHLVAVRRSVVDYNDFKIREALREYRTQRDRNMGRRVIGGDDYAHCRQSRFLSRVVIGHQEKKKAIKIVISGGNATG
jgi:hypothetical protein